MGVRNRPVTVFLCGDVMTGRGVDQILPHPGDPRLWERYAADALTYVELAERVNGPVPRPVDFAWPWGDALRVLDDVAPDARVINLETSVTRNDDAAPGKAVHYRMAPENVPCLAAARPDVCVLANNHVLDFGRLGLADTLGALAGAGIATAGAGSTAAAAGRPAAVGIGGGGRVLVLSFGAECSGIPRSWAATRDGSGVQLLPDLSLATAAAVGERARRVRRPGDVVVASVHWGSNWGYEVSRRHVDFAHRLVDAGVDIVHGHSAHHPRPIEVYRGRLVLYGCGDTIDDYEGITGHEEFRDDLRLLYFATVEPGTGRLAGLRMAPLRARRMRLHDASAGDAELLRSVLGTISRRFGTRVDLRDDGMLHLRVAGE
ncbi:CapA family protein [Dactylosporangium roseum]|uniref:CapA family protein n=1 Tax=Dactylosporangium roseum TaxID=47989 RepID=A0ABY5Z9Z7_9ACTN|nr:CapA family protein [Dactylosporangium roseum]UWZ38889.1 CapA family protein [Dactylosporangium roseum]